MVRPQLWNWSLSVHLEEVKHHSDSPHNSHKWRLKRWIQPQPSPPTHIVCMLCVSMCWVSKSTYYKCITYLKLSWWISSRPRTKSCGTPEQSTEQWNDYSSGKSGLINHFNGVFSALYSLGKFDVFLLCFEVTRQSSSAHTTRNK